MNVQPMVNVDSKHGRAVRSRKDSEGQEAVIKMKELRDKLDHLVSLFNAAADASTAYGEAVKAISEKAGLQASVVRKFVSAKVSEKFEDKKRDCEQLSLCFDEIGG
jgi:hypothetical protein